MKVEGIKAIVTKPYAGGVSILKMGIKPIAEVTVEMMRPKNKLILPLAESLAILIALLIETFP